MFSRRMFVALAALMVFTAPAFAGGGGAKKDATIVVRNDTSEPIAVFIGKDAVTKGLALTGTPTPEQIAAAGGVVVNPGASTSQKVVAGTIPVGAGAGTTDTTRTATDVTIGKGQTKSYAYTVNKLTAY
jgi:hypothetical protein